MKRSETRYAGIWDAGYDAAAEDISEAFLKFLRDGGEIRADDGWGFGLRFMVKRGGAVLSADNLLALVGFGKRRA